MDPVILTIAALAGYLIGSISFARVIVRLFASDVEDVTTEVPVSGTDQKLRMDFVSATTVSMKLGPRYGFMTVILDMLKIAIPVLVFRYVYPDNYYMLVVAVTGMIGHIWPIYYRFKGGRGMSSVYGGVFAIDWLGSIVTAILGMLIGVFVFRSVIIAYFGGLWLLIPWLWFRTSDPAYVIYAVVVNIIFLIAMRPEIAQVIHFYRQGLAPDFSEQVKLTGMGRGIYKMGKRFGAFKEVEPESKS